MTKKLTELKHQYPPLPSELTRQTIEEYCKLLPKGSEFPLEIKQYLINVIQNQMQKMDDMLKK